MKGISPLIATIILIAFVIAVVALVSTFFTSFTSRQSAKVETLGSALMDCSLAWFEIDSDVVNVGSTVSVIVENKGQSGLTGLKIVVYNSSGAFQLDASPSTMEIGDVRMLQASYSGEPVLEKLKVTSTGCPGLEDSVDFTYIYQEDADETYKPVPDNFLFDGNWDAFNYYDGYAYCNYSKPAGSVGALWRVKDEEGMVNLTVPSECWKRDYRLLMFRIFSGETDDIYWACRNSTGWETLRFVDWSETGSYTVSEEAIWWNKVET